MGMGCREGIECYIIHEIPLGSDRHAGALPVMTQTHVHALQAAAAPADQPTVNTAASKYYVLQYSVRVSLHIPQNLQVHIRTALCSNQNCHLVQYVPDMADRRGPHREGHLAAIKEWVCAIEPLHNNAMHATDHFECSDDNDMTA